MRVRSEPSLERSQKEASARSEYLKERFREAVGGVAGAVDVEAGGGAVGGAVLGLRRRRVRFRGIVTRKGSQPVRELFRFHGEVADPSDEEQEEDPQ